MPEHCTFPNSGSGESGNVIFFILLAIALIGLVTVAIRSGGEGANIDRETLVIRVSEIRQYVSDLERGVSFILQNGASENDLRFSHPDADPAYGLISDNTPRQVFADTGGGVQYRLPSPAIIAGGAASAWEFYGNTNLPNVGVTDPGARRAELLAVLPNVTAEFCERINSLNGQTAIPTESGSCDLHNTALRFASGSLYTDGVGANTLDEASFTVTPPLQACVECSGPVYHFYHVLLAR